MANKRSRGWCFTVQNWTDEDAFACYGLWDHDDNCKYIIMGFEEASKTGTPHIQGYIYYGNPVRFTELKSKLWRDIHIEAQKSFKNCAAYVYCMEGGDWSEFGERPRQGHRTDIAAIMHDIVDKKKPLSEVMVEYPNQFMQYFRPIGKYYDTFVKYKTELWGIDTTAEVNDLFKVMGHVYTKYSPDHDKLITSNYEVSIVELSAVFSSGKYRFIFYPIEDSLTSQYTGFIRASGIEKLY